MEILATTEANEHGDIDARHLQHLNFDFVDSKTAYLTHGLHPYPAKFIPQIPDTLITELSREGDVIADVFCRQWNPAGGGTLARSQRYRIRCKSSSLPNYQSQNNTLSAR